MPVDLQVQPLLDIVAQMGDVDLADTDPDTARALFAAMPRMTEPPEVATVDDRMIPGPVVAIPIRVYTPPLDGPRPLVLYFHGGGWVVGSIETDDDTCREFCRRSGAVVVSVEYRLAPEDPFPAAPDDCYAALEWCHGHAEDLGADPDRLAVAGDSAGGNLAAVVSLMSRDRGGPPIGFQLLVNPVTDFEPTASYVENGKGYLLTASAMEWAIGHYVGHDSEHRANPYAAPLQGEDLSGLPPAMVLTAEFDPVRDEGEAYAARLDDAGVDTVHIRLDGQVHGFFSMFSTVDAADRAMDDAVAALRGALV